MRDRMFSWNRVSASEVYGRGVEVSTCSQGLTGLREPRGDGHSEHEAGDLVLNFSSLNIDRDRARLTRPYRVNYTLFPAISHDQFLSKSLRDRRLFSSSLANGKVHPFELYRCLKSTSQLVLRVRANGILSRIRVVSPLVTINRKEESVRRSETRLVPMESANDREIHRNQRGKHASVCKAVTVKVRSRSRAVIYGCASRGSFVIHSKSKTKFWIVSFGIEDGEKSKGKIREFGNNERWEEEDRGGSTCALPVNLASCVPSCWHCRRCFRCSPFRCDFQRWLWQAPRVCAPEIRNSSGTSLSPCTDTSDTVKSVPVNQPVDANSRGVNKQIGEFRLARKRGKKKEQRRTFARLASRLPNSPSLGWSPLVACLDRRGSERNNRDGNSDSFIRLVVRHRERYRPLSTFDPRDRLTSRSSLASFTIETRRLASIPSRKPTLSFAAIASDRDDRRTILFCRRAGHLSTSSPMRSHDRLTLAGSIGGHCMFTDLVTDFHEEAALSFARASVCDL